MKASTKNIMMGMFHIVKGTVRATMGTSFRKHRLAWGGRVERIGGKARSTFGRMERSLGR